MVPEDERPGALQRLIESGEVSPPAELGTPDLELKLAANVDSLSDLLIAERDKQRRR